MEHIEFAPPSWDDATIHRLVVVLMTDNEMIPPLIAHMMVKTHIIRVKEWGIYNQQQSVAKIIFTLNKLAWSLYRMIGWFLSVSVIITTTKLAP